MPGVYFKYNAQSLSNGAQMRHVHVHVQGLAGCRGLVDMHAHVRHGLGMTSTFFFWKSNLVHGGMHMEAYNGAELAVPKACTAGLRRRSNMVKDENSSGKQTATRIATHTPKILVPTGTYATATGPDTPNLPTLFI